MKDNMNQNITELVKRAIDGDAATFSRIYELTWLKIVYSAYKIVGNKHDAEEISQETFLTAYKEISSLRSPEAFNSWFYRILMNKCNKALLKRSANKVNETVSMKDLGDLLPETYSAYLPEEFVSKKEIRTQVVNAINSLTPNQRAAVVMFYYQQLSYEEIAVALGITKEGVESRLRRAKEAMKECIKKTETKSALFSFMPFSVIIKALYEEAAATTFAAPPTAVFSTGVTVAAETAAGSAAKAAVVKFVAARAVNYIPATVLTAVAGLTIAAAMFVGLNFDGFSSPINLHPSSAQGVSSFQEEELSEASVNSSVSAVSPTDPITSSSEVQSESSISESASSVETPVGIRYLADMIGEADAIRLRTALLFTDGNAERVVKEILSAHPFVWKSEMKEGLDVYEGSYTLYFMEKGDKRLLMIVRTNAQDMVTEASIAMTGQQEGFPKDFDLAVTHAKWQTVYVP